MISRILCFSPSKEIHILLLPKNRPEFLEFSDNKVLVLSDLAFRIIMLTSLRFSLYSSLSAFTLGFLAFRMSLSLIFICDFISTDSHGQLFLTRWQENLSLYNKTILHKRTYVYARIFCNCMKISLNFIKIFKFRYETLCVIYTIFTV